MLRLKAFMVMVFAELLVTSCGQSSSENSKLNGNSPSVSDCQGQVARKIDGTNTYFRYIAGTTGEQSTASRGKITGCWYPTDPEAKTEVRNTCNRGGTANCDGESLWQRETASMTFNLSGVMQPAEPAPAAGGCYQKLASNYNIVCREKGKKSDCDSAYWAGCGWAEPKDSDYDGIADVNDLCPTEKETKNGYFDFDGCPDQPPPVIKQLQTIKFGTLNWVQTKTFSYVTWDGSNWTAQIMDDGKFSIIKYGTLNWLSPQRNIQIKRVLVVNGQEVEQDVLLEVTGTGFQYIANGTLNWNVVPNFEYRSWEIPDGQISYGRTTVEIVR